MGMKKLMKWKKAMYIASAVGIIGLSAYGIFRTANAYHDIQQLQTADDALTVSESYSESGLVSGSVCSPLGCAACSGCVEVQYQQSIEAVPSAAVDIEQIY